MTTIKAIDAADYFKDKTTEISSEYDFNKDGTVDVADYRYACLTLNNDDASDDVNVSQKDLDNIFAELIKLDEENNKAETITESNVNTVAISVVKSINSSESKPENATTLNNLQQIGANLTKYIAECTTIAQTLEPMIESGKKEVEKLKKEKEAKEAEYENIKEDIDKASEDLNRELQNILNINSEKEKKCTEVVNSTIQAYINGEYENQSLERVISQRLFYDCNVVTTALDNALDKCTAKGNKIKSYCTQINTLAGDIRSANIAYNQKNSFVQYCNTNRNNVLEAGQTASNLYQTGYEQRQTMRADIIEDYHVSATANVDKTTTSNAQLGKLQNFLDNSELNNMPFSDAWYVLKNSFDDCGITYNDDYSITIPNTSDTTAQNIYDALETSLKRNYGITTSRTDTPSTTTDGVFIVSAYKTSAITNAELTVGDNILDFCSQTSRRHKYFSGSGDHNDNTTNDSAWLEFYNKLSDENKNLSLTSGQAYIFSSDGTLLGTAASTQIADVNYSGKYSKRRADSSLTNSNFSVTSDLGITNTMKADGEEGSGGQITLNGITYNVAQTIYRKNTPLILDLNGDGIETTSVDKGVNFDLNADGTTDRTAWTATQDIFDDAFLVLDKNQDGQINDGSELFGDQNGAEDGFAELSKYDSNNDGKVDKNDEAYSQMQLWCDKNADGKVDDGELKSLEEMGVAELNVNYNKQYDAAGNLLEDAYGNTIGLQGTFTKTDGTSGNMIDVLFKNTDLSDYAADNETQYSSSEYFTSSNEKITFSEKKISVNNPFAVTDVEEVDTAAMKRNVNRKINNANSQIDEVSEELTNLINNQNAEKNNSSTNEDNSNEKSEETTVQTTDTLNKKKQK